MIRPIWSVHCDAEGCCQWVAQEPTEDDAIREARRMGWEIVIRVRGRGRSIEACLCPKHVRAFDEGLREWGK